MDNGLHDILGSISCSAFAAFLFVETTRFDRQLLMALLRTFDAWYLFANAAVWFTSFAWANFKIGAQGMQLLINFIALVVSYTYIIMLDAAPSYPRVLKFTIAGSIAVCTWFVFAMNSFNSEFLKEQYDTKLCPIPNFLDFASNKCFSTRSIVQACVANLSVLMLKTVVNIFRGQLTVVKFSAAVVQVPTAEGATDGGLEAMRPSLLNINGQETSEH